MKIVRKRIIEQDNIKYYDITVPETHNYLLEDGTVVHNCGVSVERQFINKLPEIPEELVEVDDTIEFKDSKRGWAEGLNLFIKSMYEGKIMLYNLDKIRPAGTRLKTFGGRASGPEPLRQLLDYCKEKFLNSKGRKLNSEEVLDIVCKISDVVVVGGVRRAALIILSNLSDERMRHVKDGEFWITHPHRALANISVAYTEKPSPEVLMKEWISLIRSKTGERGIFNREGLKSTISLNDRRDSNYEFGLNPCITGDTKILVVGRGHVDIKKLAEEGKDIPVYSFNRITNKPEIQIMRNPRITGLNKKILKITLNDGSQIRCTENHKFIMSDKSIKEAKDLLINDKLYHMIRYHESFDVIFGSQNNSKSQDYIWINSNGKTSSDHRLIAEFKYKKKLKQNEIIHHKDFNVKYKSKQYNYFKTLLKESDLDIFFDFDKNIIYTNKQCEHCKKNFIIEWAKREKMFCSIECYNISRKKIDFISKHRILQSKKRIKQINAFKELKEKLNKDPMKKEFCIYCRDNKIPFRMRSEKEQINNEFLFTSWNEFKSIANSYENFEIISIEEDGYENVYNGTVENNHNFYIFTSETKTKNNKPKFNYICSLQCGEVVLRNNEFCNLTEVVIKENDNLDILKQKVRYATILGVVQSTLTNFKFINRNWKKNCEEERLLGVSLTGLADHNILNKVSSKSKEWLFSMKQESEKTMKEWCNALEINQSAQLTAVKPSGTVSQMVGSSSGLHPRFSQFYIRRVRVDKLDPLAKFMENMNVPCQPENGQTWENYNTLVFEFPVKSPESAIMRDEMPAIKQLEYWRMIKEYWCEGNPSCTIYVKNEEWVEVLAWVWKYWDYIGGLSFLPYDGGVYKLAPYEEIDEETYDKLIKEFPDIDFKNLDDFELNDETIGGQEFACVAGACELT